MNSRVIGAILLAIGANVLKQSNNTIIMQGTDIEKRQAIAGIVTAGSGIYVMGRADGFRDGYEAGAKRAVVFLSTLGRVVNK